MHRSLKRERERAQKHSFLTGQFTAERVSSDDPEKKTCRVVTGRMLMEAALAGGATGVAALPGPM
jgi:hypothetical protein